MTQTSIRKTTRLALFRRVLSKAASLVSVSGLALTTTLHPIITYQVHAQEKVAQNYVRITAANASVPKAIRLGLDKSLVVDLPTDAQDILVANPRVADAVTRTSRRLYLFGKQVGQTNVFVFDGRGKQIAAMEITIERDIAGLETTLARLIKNSDIKAEMINDNIVLTGVVSTPSDSAKAVALAQIFVKGGEATQGNNTQSTSTVSLFARPPESDIVNLLKIDGEDQVHLKVTIAEVQRSVIKQLGISTSVTNPGTDGFGFTSVAAGAFLETVSPGIGTGISLAHGLNTINAQLSALESAGVMRTLAEPSLTAVSGEQANFSVGGTVQAPNEVSTGDNGGLEITYDRLDYGIALTFTPVVLTEGRISLKLRTEVKEPTSVGSSTIRRDANLIGIRHRTADTTVELPSGGSMIIAGLVQDDVRQTVTGHPALKNIPVLGALFRSREFIRNETEVMIIVTPYLVRPTARRKLAQPDENFQPASDAAGIFMGRVNRVFGTKKGNLPKGRYTGSIGFILK